VPLLCHASQFAARATTPSAAAYWAGCVTAAFAFPYGYFGQTGAHLLYIRLSGIVWGGAIPIAASWLILPIRAGDVLRDAALTALTDVLTTLRGDPALLPQQRTRFDHALSELDRIAPPLVALERLNGRPGDWPGRPVRSPHCTAALHRSPTWQLRHQRLGPPAHPP
jgi:hypothetical protein